jgi:hypothetical protein
MKCWAEQGEEVLFCAVVLKRGQHLGAPVASSAAYERCKRAIEMLQASGGVHAGALDLLPVQAAGRITKRLAGSR